MGFEEQQCYQIFVRQTAPNHRIRKFIPTYTKKQFYRCDDAGSYKYFSANSVRFGYMLSLSFHKRIKGWVRIIRNVVMYFGMVII